MSLIIYNNLRYALNSPYPTYATVVGNSGATGAVTIPSTITDSSGNIYKVRGVADEAFKSDIAITSLDFSSNVRTIGAYAFESSRIQSLNLPFPISLIGDGFCLNCTLLTSVTWSSCYTFIPQYAFKGCTSLAVFPIPSTIVAIGQEAFMNSGIVTLTLPDDFVSLSYSTFEGCTSLTTIVFKDLFTSCFPRCFYGCTSLTSITFPKNQFALGDLCFAYTGLTSIVLPLSFYPVSSGANIFEGCTSLVSATCFIPQGGGTFKNCTNLNTVTIYGYPQTNDFEGCTSLQNPSAYGTMNSTLEAGSFFYNQFFPAGTNGFYMNYNFIETGNYYDSASDLTFEYNVLTLTAKVIAYGRLNSFDPRNPNVVIPSTLLITPSSGIPTTFTVNEIGSLQRTFGSSSYDLQSIVIPNSIIYFSDRIFASCYGLASVTFPTNMTNVPRGMFFECTSLPDINFLPSTITSIGAEAFSFCHFTSITIPSNILYIQPGAFEQNYFLTSFTFASGTTKIQGGLFFFCTALTSITIPEGVTTIGGSAFAYCLSLQTVVLPSTISTILPRAFSDCESLTSINFPDFLSNLEEGLFANCISLEEYTFPPTVGELPINCFAGCSALTSVTIPDIVTALPDGLLSGTALETFTIPPQINTLGDGVFQDCISLKEIIFA
jgi:hypothetical protein